jgi:N-acetylmuramic acid 6-phosphate (MurNAc-6-P) etherase
MHKDFIRTTESSSLYQNIEATPTAEILKNINKEDAKVAFEVEKVIPSNESLMI